MRFLRPISLVRLSRRSITQFRVILSASIESLRKFVLMMSGGKCLATETAELLNC